MTVDIKVVAFPRAARNGATPPAPKELATISVESDASVEHFKSLLAKQIKLGPERHRILVGTERSSASLEDSKKISDYSLANNSIVYFKDLGPQISWKGVFLIEYFGPLLVYFLLYLQPSFLYGPSNGHTLTQHIAFLCWSAHYIKRELETLFVHRFSHGTMPLSNLFKNCSYYWGNAIIVAYFVNHPLFTEPPAVLLYIGLALFIVNELGNLYTHIILMNLRPAGSRERRIPRGFLFEYVSCPNYFCEIVAWIGFSLMTQSLASYIFTAMGAFQMVIWAQKKHSQYRKEFPDYPKNRKILVPFVY
eukprot:TRINITY_DN9337_c0_g1_i1.p1 TRINITY_DN9337_c0_g1~~TRINITY_DN9337_c0_g1_i1.p1  ORF type:complete len:314 (+),score=129.48 TRINITY_DN9337_c0_g1_i1:25-942(+)